MHLQRSRHSHRTPRRPLCNAPSSSPRATRHCARRRVGRGRRWRARRWRSMSRWWWRRRRARRSRWPTRRRTARRRRARTTRWRRRGWSSSGRAREDGAGADAARRGGRGPGDDAAAAEADVTRLRIILDASRAFALDRGGKLTPALDLGLRQDGGDAETGTRGRAWAPVRLRGGGRQRRGRGAGSRGARGRLVRGVGRERVGAHRLRGLRARALAHAGAGVGQHGERHGAAVGPSSSVPLSWPARNEPWRVTSCRLRTCGREPVSRQRKLRIAATLGHRARSCPRRTLPLGRPRRCQASTRSRFAACWR